MDITVILCTYNRSEHLATALNSAAALLLPESVEWEILVVDNNSKDRTQEVVADFCNRYPTRFRYLFEPQQGKSYALNTGIREARGDIVAFMDDDVRVEPTWLQNLTAALYNEEWTGAGGRILPEWACSPPRWLPPQGRHALAPLVAFDLGPEAGQLNEPPFGTNMAFRKEMFEKYGGFRTDLGPQPRSEIRGEDSEFGSRLLSAGERLRYEPSAVVYHPVPANRIQKKYFLAWWFDKGRANIRQCGARFGARVNLFEILFYYLYRVSVGCLRWMVTFGAGARFSRKIDVWEQAGEIAEFCRQSLRASKRSRNYDARNIA
jgi:glycosyltransferase involved in cell wall biosynthesis